MHTGNQLQQKYFLGMKNHYFHQVFLLILWFHFHWRNILDHPTMFRAKHQIDLDDISGIFAMIHLPFSLPAIHLFHH